jgi:hypothetical protein
MRPAIQKMETAILVAGALLTLLIVGAVCYWTAREQVEAPLRGPESPSDDASTANAGLHVSGPPQE